MQSTTVSGSDEARLLNSRTEVAHVDVSMLGKIFRITFFSEKSPNVISFKSMAVSLKGIAEEPIFGKSPLVFTVTSLSFVCAIFEFL